MTPSSIPSPGSPSCRSDTINTFMTWRTALSLTCGSSAQSCWPSASAAHAAETHQEQATQPRSSTLFPSVARRLKCLSQLLRNRSRPRLSLRHPFRQYPSKCKGQPAASPGFKYFQNLFHAEGTQALLLKNGFAVDGNTAYDEFYQVYEQNRYRPLTISTEDTPEGGIRFTYLSAIPSVVTPDVVLHNLHLYFDYTLAQTEALRLLPETRQIVQSAFEATLEQRERLANSKWSKAIEDNLVFLGVAQALLSSADLKLPVADEEEDVNPDSAAEIEAFTQLTRDNLAKLIPIQLPTEPAARVHSELERIVDAKVKETPQVFRYPSTYKEDYTLYRVRGHYVKMTSLQAYFRATQWLSRTALFVAEEQSSRSAVLLALAVSKPATLTAWKNVSQAIDFLIGPADDASFPELLSVLEKHARNASLDDDATFKKLMVAFAQVPSPQAQSVVTTGTQGPDLAAQKAFHFFPQRSTVDAVIFQGLVTPKVEGKNFIRALEVPAVLGSSLATTLLASENLNRFEKYESQRAQLKQAVSATVDTQKAANAFTGWLYSLQPLLSPALKNGPGFMQTDAYQSLRLSSYLASYAQLKHDTVLYAKQSIGEMGGGSVEEVEVDIDKRGYVIPEVQLYARISTLLKNLKLGLNARQLFPTEIAESFERFENLVQRLESISRKELSGAALTKEDYHLIEFIGGDLEHFWEETLIQSGKVDRMVSLIQNNARIVADVFTGPRGVTHVASGYVQPAYFVFPREGKPAVGRGAVLSFYELTTPERLSDDAWRKRLEHNDVKQVPRQPTWVNSFVARDVDKSMHVEAPPEY